MSLYMSIQSFQTSGDAKAYRKERQDGIDFFSAWTAPTGTTMLHLWLSVDGSKAISVWESDSHAALTTLAAQFSPYGAIELIPIATADEAIPAQAAGGLYKLG